MALKNNYFKELRRRTKESRIYRKYQLTGLQVAKILGDEKHKALYIKLAKIHDSDELFRLAKETAERNNIKNRGAYFMSCLFKKANAGQNSHHRKQSRRKNSAPRNG